MTEKYRGARAFMNGHDWIANQIDLAVGAPVSTMPGASPRTLCVAERMARPRRSLRRTGKDRLTQKKAIGMPRLRSRCTETRIESSVREFMGSVGDKYGLPLVKTVVGIIIFR
jgi:hypothetical protein